MVQFAGPAFANLVNRIMSLHLVQPGLTNAVMFSPSGEVLQPSDVRCKKAVLVQRGIFRPITRINVDRFACGTAQFGQEPRVAGREIVVLAEILMNPLQADGALDHQDFLSRVDFIGEPGFTTLISNYSEYYRLTSYFRRYTREMIGIVMGVGDLLEIFDERHYEHLEGGILESFGRMFRNAVKLYIHPGRPAGGDQPRENDGNQDPGGAQNPVAPTGLATARKIRIAEHLRNLYAHLLENHYIDRVAGFDSGLLDSFPNDLLQRIKAGDPIWEENGSTAGCQRDQEPRPLWVRHAAGCNRFLSELGRHGLSP